MNPAAILTISFESLADVTVGQFASWADVTKNCPMESEKVRPEYIIFLRPFLPN